MAGGGKAELILLDYENIYNTFNRIKNTQGLAEAIFISNSELKKLLTNFQNYLISETDSYSGKFGGKTKGQFTDNKLAVRVYKALGGKMLSENLPQGVDPNLGVNKYLESFGKKTNDVIDTVNKKTRMDFGSREAFY
jgi:hypothetical protein